MSWQVEMRDGSIYLPEIDLWCDARRPVPCSFVSHAHSDHLARHRRVITSPGTRRLMAARLPGKREELVLPFDQPHAFDRATELRLYPAGHILGSAMLHLTRGGESFLYTGDFKLGAGLAAELCTPPRADVVVMETTFGLPRYALPPREKVLADIVDFCRSAIADGAVPVLLGYSLGKSQELLASLAGAGLPIMLHPQAEKITLIYEELGQTFPPWRSFAISEVAGHVVICPPQASQSESLRQIKSRRVAVVTGWAMDSSTIYRSRCDAAFPLSDHADFNELLQFVEAVQPKLVYTVHGFVDEFARTLRQRGIEAWALGRTNQMDLALKQARPTGLPTSV